MPHTGATDEQMRRVLVIGCAGAGKTTFSHRLGTMLSLPVINLDRYFWRPHWQLPDMREWRETVMEIAAAPEWIMDGNYSSTFDIRMPRADTVIWLDSPRHVCMRRVLVRTLKGYGRTRPDGPAGCPERIDLGFFRFVWDFHSKSRPRILEGMRTYGRNFRLFQFNTDDEAERFLSRVGSS
jgi:adenylate kinase family enzyme